MAVQIVATGFSGLRFLRQSHRLMTEDFIRVYGGYAIKLLRLQTALIQALDRHRRGNSQTVEVQHVHLYPGAKASSHCQPASGRGSLLSRFGACRSDRQTVHASRSMKN
jgi:hypothetical protein